MRRCSLEHRARPSYSPAYLRYALGLLCVVYVVNFVDRQVLSILLQSIKEDLGLSDLQLGLLSGTAFGLFYATLGIPIARLADRFSRKGVIAVCLALWSAMTALCGTASGFATLLLYRVGVGVGEAGGSPPAHSMISDYFPPERRASALGVFSLGVPLGILVGFLAGGWLDEALGWRLAFVVVGLPGVVLAVVVALTLREPPRGHSEGLAAAHGEAPGAFAVMPHLWRRAASATSRSDPRCTRSSATRRRPGCRPSSRARTAWRPATSAPRSRSSSGSAAASASTWAACWRTASPAAIRRARCACRCGRCCSPSRRASSSSSPTARPSRWRPSCFRPFWD